MKALIIFLLVIVFLGFMIGKSFAKECGIASVYSTRESGRKTASGKPLNDNALTAAHKTRPFGSKVIVNGKNQQITVTITDRGPFIKGRIIDLTIAGARQLGFSGLLKVCIE